jgi:hypothetical protein
MQVAPLPELFVQWRCIGGKGRPVRLLSVLGGAALRTC